MYATYGKTNKVYYVLNKKQLKQKTRKLSTYNTFSFWLYIQEIILKLITFSQHDLIMHRPCH